MNIVSNRYIPTFAKLNGDLLISKKEYTNMRAVHNLPVIDVFDYSVSHDGLIGSFQFYNDYIVVLGYKKDRR